MKRALKWGSYLATATLVVTACGGDEGGDGNGGAGGTESDASAGTSGSGGSAASGGAGAGGSSGGVGAVGGAVGGGGSASVDASVTLDASDASDANVVCTEPPAGGLVLWLDADDATTTGGMEGPIATWGDRSDTAAVFGLVPIPDAGVDASSTGAADAGAGNDPTLVTDALSGRRVVRFDGNDSMSFDGFSALTGMDEYTIFVVATVEEPSNTILAAHRSGPEHGIALQTLGNDLRFLHRMPFGTSGGDDLITKQGNYLGLPQLFTAYRGGGSQVIRRNGGHEESVTVGTIGLNEAVTVVLGNIDSGLGDRFLSGDIAEILIYASDVGAAGRDCVEEYLSYKWFDVAPTAILGPEDAVVDAGDAGDAEAGYDPCTGTTTEEIAGAAYTDISATHSVSTESGPDNLVDGDLTTSWVAKAPGTFPPPPEVVTWTVSETECLDQIRVYSPGNLDTVSPNWTFNSIIVRVYDSGGDLLTETSPTLSPTAPTPIAVGAIGSKIEIEVSGYDNNLAGLAELSVLARRP